MFMDDFENQPVQETQTETPQEQAEQPQETVSRQRGREDDSDRNLRSLREKTERAERERDEAYRLIKEYESRLPNADDSDTDVNLGADDIAEGKHLSKVQKKIKNLEEQLRSYQQQNALTAAELRLRNKYPDFDKVVTKDNIDLLKDKNPSAARLLASAQDADAAGESAYLFIKQLTSSADPSYDKERELVQKNSVKPRPLASVSPQQGDSPLTRANAFANGLTDELKDQLRKEMFEARKQL